MPPKRAEQTNVNAVPWVTAGVAGIERQCSRTTVRNIPGQHSLQRALMNILSRRSRATPAVAGSGYSLLDGQLTVTGDLDTAASLRIDGSLRGTIKRADTVVLGVFATMVGDIHAREVIIGGSLTGSVFASERVELQATAIVNGDLSTLVVLVQEGGVINGRVIMPAPASPDRTSVDTEPSTIVDAETTSSAPR